MRQAAKVSHTMSNQWHKATFYYKLNLQWRQFAANYCSILKQWNPCLSIIAFKLLTLQCWNKHLTVTHRANWQWSNMHPTNKWYICNKHTFTLEDCASWCILSRFFNAHNNLVFDQRTYTTIFILLNEVNLHWQRKPCGFQLLHTGQTWKANLFWHTVCSEECKCSR